MDVYFDLKVEPVGEGIYVQHITIKDTHLRDAECIDEELAYGSLNDIIEECRNNSIFGALINWGVENVKTDSDKGIEWAFKMIDTKNFRRHERERLTKEKDSFKPLIPFSELRWGGIIGLIEDNGNIVSQRYERGEIKSHYCVFGERGYKGWRWCFDNGIDASVYARDSIEKEDFAAVRKHLTDKYSIQWWSNGYHDLDHFIKHMSE